MRMAADYLLSTQVVPHITDAIQDWIKRVAHIPVDGKSGPAKHQYWSFGLGLNRWGNLDCLKAVCFKRVCYCDYLSHSKGKTLPLLLLKKG